MIVKVKNNREECWDYFEGDGVIQHIYKDKDPRYKEDTFYLIDGNLENNRRIELTIHKDKKVAHRVFTNQPTYLMNNDGKTVDKLI